jgi:hypothetical protein
MDRRKACRALSWQRGPDRARKSRGNVAGATTSLDRERRLASMWQYGITDVPFFTPGLTNMIGSGTFGFTQPTWGTPINTIGYTPFGTSPIGYTPFGTTQFGYSPFGTLPIGYPTLGTPQVGLGSFGTPFNFLKTEWNPYLGYKTDWNPFFGYKTDWNPFLGYKPEWSSFFGYKPEFGLGLTPWTLGQIGTPYGFKGFSPFGLSPLDERLKFGMPFTTGLFGFQTPYQTAFDWKVKSFGTPFGLTTDTWTKPLYTNIPWTTGTLSGPVSVL